VSRLRCWCTWGIFVVCARAPAADFYVATNGTTSTAAGTGTFGNPWALQTALNQPAAVQPGDTIWLRGGTYRGSFASYLSGTPAAPIKVRQYPGERATVDGNATATLSASISSSATTLTLSSTCFSPDPFDVGVGVVHIDSEQIHLFLLTGTTYTIDRGWNGTLPAAHGAGALVTTNVVTLAVYGSNTWFMGFELTNSGGFRSNPVAGSLPPNRLGFSMDVYGPGTKILNMVIHDAGQGIGLWTAATGAEATGNIIFYNGWEGPDEGHGHGIYTQNQAPSVKRITENVLFDQFALGIQAYTESGAIDGIQLQGNVSFSNGVLSHLGGYTDNLLIGGLQVAQTPSMTSNLTYSPTGAGDQNLGYNAGCTNASVTGNTFVGMFRLVNCLTGLSMTGNNFYGQTTGFTPSSFPSNTYLATRPTVNQVFVRPNPYETGRGHVVVYNWQLLSSVSVNLSSVVTVGSSYEIRNAQNFYAAPVASGTYAGGSVSLPMGPLSVAAPAGVAAPPATGPEFNVFVVLAAPPAKPASAFTFAPASPSTNTSVSFTDASTGSPTSWQWDFGDGTTSTAQNPSHVYAVGRTYTVTLNAANAGGVDQTTRAVTVTAPAVSGTAHRFNTVPPCRVVDTRNPDGSRGGPALAATSLRTFPVTGVCGIPSDATAISANLTVISPPAAGEVRVYPGNFPVPSSWVVTFRAGKTRAGAAMVTLATDGTGAVGVRNEASGAVHFVLDVNGYFK
jgi:PKD repeat protein